MKSKVYFTSELTPESVVKMYRVLGKDLQGKVAVKVHSGEKGNFNFLGPEFWKPMIDEVGGRVVETNTAYGDRFVGVRDHTDSHRKLLEEHGWSRYFDVDLMDEEGPDHVFEIPDGHILKKNVVGKHLLNYDSMLVLAHFKGHPNGGYGGALKQLSIGCASSAGKALIHSAGRSDDRIAAWDMHADNTQFPECMADAATTVVRHFCGNMAFINVMKNLSIDCDCVATPEKPCMKDIGMLSSLDPVAIDQACIDLVVNSDDPGRDHFMARVNELNGIHTIETAEELGIGSREYELIRLRMLKQGLRPRFSPFSNRHGCRSRRGYLYGLQLEGIERCEAALRDRMLHREAIIENGARQKAYIFHRYRGSCAGQRGLPNMENHDPRPREAGRDLMHSDVRCYECSV